MYVRQPYYKKMTLFLKNWTVIRLMRLSLGGFILYDGIRSQEWLFIAFGVYFTGLAILNLGCFGAQQCSVPTTKNNSVDQKVETKFEEVH